MAKQVITKILDDLDGGDADETLTFALDGMGYEIDLSAKNAKKLRDFLETYQDAGTRTGRVGSGPQLQRHQRGSGHMATVAQSREQNMAIRQWASSNGYQLAERGRIPQHIVDAFTANKPNPDAVEALAAEAATPTPKKAAKPAAVVDFTPPAKSSRRSA